MVGKYPSSLDFASSLWLAIFDKKGPFHNIKDLFISN